MDSPPVFFLIRSKIDRLLFKTNPPINVPIILPVFWWTIGIEFRRSVRSVRLSLNLSTRVISIKDDFVEMTEGIMDSTRKKGELASIHEVPSGRDIMIKSRLYCVYVSIRDNKLSRAPSRSWELTFSERSLFFWSSCNAKWIRLAWLSKIISEVAWRWLNVIASSLWMDEPVDR